MVAARDSDEAVKLLRAVDPRRVFTHDATNSASSVAFLFPGGGAQYPGMGAGLYESEPVFREWSIAGSRLRNSMSLKICGLDLSAPMPGWPAARDALERPSLAAARDLHHRSTRWRSSGCRGASARRAHRAQHGREHRGVPVRRVSLRRLPRARRAARQVDGRDRARRHAQRGSLRGRADPAAREADLDLASINAPAAFGGVGSRVALEALERTLAERAVDARWIRIHIAAHSRMLEPILPRYVAYLRSIALSEPRIPIVSNLTGKWLTREQAVDPEYWGTHLRQTVLFADGIKTLLEEPRRALLEVGPGKTLSSLARQHPDMSAGQASSRRYVTPTKTCPMRPSFSRCSGDSGLRA